MRYFIISGTSKGIGKALAELYLSQENTTVIGLSRTNDISHARYTHHSIDLSDIAVLIAALPNLFPALAANDEVILINNAGNLGEIGYMGSISHESIRQVFDINVTAVGLLMNAFIKTYVAHKGQKVILNISSGAGKSPVDGWSAYCASKAAVDMLSRVAAEENKLVNSGLHVFSVAPGVVDTAMQTAIRGADKGGFSKIDRFLELKANNSLSSPEEVAKQLAQIIDAPHRFAETILDVRQI